MLLLMSVNKNVLQVETKEFTMALEEMLEFIRHPEGNISVWTWFHGNPSHNWRNKSLRTTNVNLITVQEQKTEAHQRQQASSSMYHE